MNSISSSTSRYSSSTSSNFNKGDNMNDTASISSGSGSGRFGGDVNPIEITTTPKNSATNDNNDAIIGGVLYNDIITEIHDHDVLCGRGRGEYHPGNIWFRTLLRENISLYRNCPKHTKKLIAKQVVAAFTQQRSPPGRFIKPSTTDASGVVVGWIQITYKQAVAKASKALRQKNTPYLSPTNTSPQPTFVNGKQYCRILKRREARAKMEEYLTKKRAMNLLSSSSSSGDVDKYKETTTATPTTEAVTTATATATAILPLVMHLPSPVANDAIAKKRKCNPEYQPRKRQKREGETDEEEKIRLKKEQLLQCYRRMLFSHSNEKYNPPFLHKEFNEAEFRIRMTDVLDPFAKWVLDVTHDQITKLPLDKIACVDHMHGLPGYIRRSQDGMFRCVCSGSTNLMIATFERAIAANSASSEGTADITDPYDIMNVKNETLLADVIHMLTVIIPALKKDWKEAPTAKIVRDEERQDREKIKSNRGKRSHNKGLSESAVEYLEAWMMSAEMIAKPYPTRSDKLEMMNETGLEIKQLEKWLGRYRAALKKAPPPVVVAAINGDAEEIEQRGRKKQSERTVSQVTALFNVFHI